MNYVVKSTGNGVSQKSVVIEFTTNDRVLTINGDVLVTDAIDGGYHYDIADWEIDKLDGKECRHATVWDALATLYGNEYVTYLGADIDAALIEVAGSMVTPKTPQNAPQLPATDFESSTMEQRISRIDWEAVKEVFEHHFDFVESLESALEDASLDDAAEVEVNACSYGSRDFSVELSFDNRGVARAMEDAMADAIYKFCADQAQVTVNAA